MTIIFYILVSLCLVIIKTTLIPTLPLFEKFYDLLIPIVIYLSLFRPIREGAPIIFFFGLIMDSLCGGPVGIYLATYIWLYAGMRWLSQFLHTGSFALLALSVTFGVIFEGLFMYGQAAIIPYLDLYFERRLNVPTSCINPVKEMGDLEAKSLNPRAEQEPYALALGLAMRKVTWL